MWLLNQHCFVYSYRFKVIKTPYGFLGNYCCVYKYDFGCYLNFLEKLLTRTVKIRILD